jgi:hypothetical protein
MANLVMRFRKLKTSSDMGNVANHNSRAKIFDETKGGWLTEDSQPPDWMKRPLEIGRNEGRLGRADDSINRAWNRVIEEAHLKRKPQQNASRGIEGIFTSSHGAFKTKGESRAYLKDCLEFAKKRLGEENILQWNTHYDEKTPHLHIIFAPICRTKTGNRYSSGHFLGGPEGLRQLQTDFYEYISGLKNEFGKQKYPDLHRGDPGSEKKHTDQSEWKSELVKKEKELDKRETAVKLKEEDLNKLAAGKLKEPGDKTVAMISNVFRNENVQIFESKKFWPEFFRRLPAFINQIVQDVRRGLVADQATARSGPAVKTEKTRGR